MASALSRAREEAMRGGGGEWLDNDTLIANQLVFDITDVVDDRGGGFNGQDRWIVRVEPHYANEEDPAGQISLTDNPARRKFMTVLDKELEDLLQRGDDPVIGPCCMVRLKGKNYRYIEIVDWDDENKHPILPQGAIPAGASAAEDMRPPRRPRAGVIGGGGGGQPEADNGVGSGGGSGGQTRPFVEAGENKAEPAPAPTPAPPTKRARVRTAATAEAPGASTAQESSSASFPTLEQWAKSQGHTRGRYSNALKQNYEEAKRASLGQDEYAAPKPYQGDEREVEQELAIRAAKNAVPEPAQVPVGAPSRQPIPYQGEAMAAQEIRFRAGMTGTSVEPCPACGKHIHDRIFPTTDPSGYALVHARCEAGGEQMKMDAVPDSE